MIQRKPAPAKSSSHLNVTYLHTSTKLFVLDTNV